MEIKGEIAAQTDSSSSIKLLDDSGDPITGANPLPVKPTDGTNDLTFEDDGSINVNTKESNGVPISFSKVTASGDTFAIQKGLLNKLRLRPQIINEHAESSRDIIGVVTTTNIVGQIFKASQDNINGINVSLESAAGIAFDDFESYADSAALQVEWEETGGTAAVLDTANPYAGTNCMLLDTNSPIGSDWKRDFASTDFVGYTGQFWMYSNKEYKDVKMRVFVEDSIGNTNSAAIITVNSDFYYKYIFPTASLVQDGVTAADLTDIVAIGFRVEGKKLGGLMYFDNLVSVPDPGSVDLKLWDMGASIPVTAVTSIDDGTQYEKLGDAGITGIQAATVSVELVGGKRMYHVDGFVAGVALEVPANETLTIGNYYILTMNYVDTDVSVYGPHSAYDNYYENGFAFTAPDEATAISATGADEDLMFAVFSTQNVYVSQFLQFIDAAPNGESSTSIFIEDLNMKITDVVISGVQGQQTVVQKLPRPYIMEKGAKFEQYYNDDFTDDVSSVSLNIQYFFEPNTPYG